MPRYTALISDAKKEGRARRLALYAAAAWATVDTLKKMGSGWLIFGSVAVVMLSMMLYAIVVALWWAILLGIVAWLIYRWLMWRKERQEWHDEIPF